MTFLYAVPYFLLSAAATAQEALVPPELAGIPNLAIRYYDIEGRTPAEIYTSLRQRSRPGIQAQLAATPPRDDIADAVAHTTGRIRTGWREVRRGDECVVTDPLTSLSITVVLPRLATPDPTPEGLDWWRRTLRGLEIHEAGHARMAYEHRNDFVEAARGAKCATVKAIAERTQARIDRMQAEYDRETRHGLTQTPSGDER